MTRRLLLLIYVSLLFSAIPARAQSPITLSELQIAFWPEYDQSAMLVIYRGTLAPEVALPATLTFSIPAKYGPPMAVAYGDPQGRLLNLEFTTAPSGEMMTFSFIAPAANFQFEYYDTGLDVSAPTRRYNFAGVAAYPIQTLVLQVQQPVGASGLTAAPALGQATVGTDGLTYLTAVRADVPAGDAITLDLTYTKNDSSLTISNQPPAVSTTVSPSTASAVQPVSPALVASVIVGLVGIALVGAGLAWYARSRRDVVASPAMPRQPRRPKGHPPRPKEVKLPEGLRSGTGQPSGSSTSAAFCHECGSRLQPDDVFCRDCGTKVRR
ncbi:MAG: zinc ribbon domain-containing protein [Chloroflexota bacterium]